MCYILCVIYELPFFVTECWKYVGTYSIVVGCSARMHTWDDVPVRWGVDKHTAGRLPVRDQVHVGVLVVVEGVGGGRRRGLWGRYKIVLIVQG